MAARPGWAKNVATGYVGTAAIGFAAVAAFVLGFGGWAATAPLAGAAVAPGVVAASGRNQVVQHLEGGIVKKIFVEEGESVERGEPLFEMDATAASSERNRVQKELVALRARAERLAAERGNTMNLAFTADLASAAEATAMEDQLSEQQAEFDTRLERHRQEKAILAERVSSLESEIEGTKAQNQAVERQLDLIREEAANKKILLDKGLTERSEYSALLRAEADLLGQVGQTSSAILSARTQISEAKQQITRLDTQRVEDAVTKLNDVRTQITDDVERLRAAEAILSRIIVRSPSDGVVVSMNFNVPGSVVKPGDALLELIPTGEDLIVQARVSPSDIDVVHVGQAADLRFSALNTRTTPKVDATVLYVSADRIVDQRDPSQVYYTARLRITDDLPASLTRDEIYPGMPVETYIRTGERTFLTYLLKPIEDSFAGAFREE